MLKEQMPTVKGPLCEVGDFFRTYHSAYFFLFSLEVVMRSGACPDNGDFDEVDGDGRAQGKVIKPYR